MNQDFEYFNGNVDDVLYELVCVKCKGKLHLVYKSLIMEIEGVEIPVLGVPMLECSSCKKIYMPYTTNDVLKSLNVIMNNEQESDSISKSFENTCIDFSKYKNSQR